MSASAKLFSPISSLCNLFLMIDTSFIRPHIKVVVKRTVGLLSWKDLFRRHCCCIILFKYKRGWFRDYRISWISMKFLSTWKEYQTVHNRSTVSASSSATARPSMTEPSTSKVETFNVDDDDDASAEPVPSTIFSKRLVEFKSLMLPIKLARFKSLELSIQLVRF